MSKPIIVDDWIVETVVPWTASGPGWGNAGARIIKRNVSGEWAIDIVYRDDFSMLAHALFSIALQAESAFAMAIVGKHLLGSVKTVKGGARA